MSAVVGVPAWRCWGPLRRRCAVWRKKMLTQRIRSEEG
jgi:hypothetical protein